MRKIIKSVESPETTSDGCVVSVKYNDGIEDDVYFIAAPLPWDNVARTNKRALSYAAKYYFRMNNRCTKQRAKLVKDVSDIQGGRRETMNVGGVFQEFTIRPYSVKVQFENGTYKTKMFSATDRGLRRAETYQYRMRIEKNANSK